MTPASQPVSSFLPPIDLPALRQLAAREEWEHLLEAVVEPLHEELYRRQDFDFLDELTRGQLLMLSFDYIRVQVKQGGFIQLIQNNYTSLILPLPELLTEIDADAMAEVLDDVLRVYVLNIDSLGRETTMEEFVKLYDEFKEFEVLEARFQEALPRTLELMGRFTVAHPEQFTVLP